LNIPLTLLAPIAGEIEVVTAEEVREEERRGEKRERRVEERTR